MDLTNFQLSVLRKASETKGYGGRAAASCQRHLERAWALKDSMPEVSVFLSITAEEEAACTILHAFRKKKYDNANEIRLKDHKHKSGVYPFIRLMNDVMAPKTGALPFTLYFEENDAPGDGELKIRIPLNIKGNGREYFAIPTPPLDLVSKGPDGKERNYTEEVKSIASEKGIDNIYEYIKKLANERNKMLYATDSSLPKAKDAKTSIEHHSNAAILNLIIYLLVEPHKKQSLPQEALNAYIKILNRIDEREA